MMKWKKAASIGGMVLFLALVFFFSLLSPYDTSYLDLKQIDHDKLDVLRVAWLLLAGADAVIWAVSKPRKLWKHLLYGAVLLWAVIRLVYLFRLA